MSLAASRGSCPSFPPTLAKALLFLLPTARANGSSDSSLVEPCARPTGSGVSIMEKSSSRLLTPKLGLFDSIHPKVLAQLLPNALLLLASPSPPVAALRCW